jgi:hypothetical protein
MINEFKYILKTNEFENKPFPVRPAAILQSLKTIQEAKLAG